MRVRLPEYLRPIRWRKLLRVALYGTLTLVLLLGLATLLSLHDPSAMLRNQQRQQDQITLLDRQGIPLATQQNAALNITPAIALYATPQLLKDAFVQSEDRRFFTHGGVDWQARFAAITQNIKLRRQLRGASTITEQVVRILHPRPRNIWSKWLEGWEAIWLEQNLSKADILELYLNNIPYAGQRRGIAQAARFYFNRSPTTLNTHEMLALVILARAPSAYDLYRHPERITKSVALLAMQLQQQGKLPDDYRPEMLKLEKPISPSYAQHFARYVRQQELPIQATMRTTLDAHLQQKVQGLLDQRIAALKMRNVHNGAVLVVDHRTGDILVWAVAGAGNPDTSGGDIDAVTTPRQPGSSMKPFLYALAIEKGWHGGTLLNDAPLTEAIGAGLHRFRNYSGQHYGQITLREALGNSLNIPALLTIRYVGTENYLNLLHRFGFSTLTRGADTYDEGLALGIGEVSLLEMVRAYATLAEKGQYRDLHVVMQQGNAEMPARNRTVLSAETASLVGNILSDPWARRLEFGSDSVLNMATQTAVKTGTSNDYNDAWVFGYNDRFVVGIWMGNLDRKPMETVTGSTGPALVMRSIFTELNRGRETNRLYLSPKLLPTDICIRPADENGHCALRTEYLTTDMQRALKKEVRTGAPARTPFIELVRPTANLQIAYDPRIPAAVQKFRFELKGLPDTVKGLQVTWLLNGRELARTQTPTYTWSVSRGRYTLAVKIHTADFSKELGPVPFRVK